MKRELVIETIATTTHGRYVAEVPEGDGPFPLLIGFHGYAQNAETNLREVLQQIPNSESWIRVAVQGLHSFYNSRTQEVIASWMTRLHRELAIADNIEYVRNVVDAVRRDLPAGDPIVFLGFSQGVAMAFRAAAAIPCKGVIANGGDVPPDVATAAMSLPPVLIARGLRDEWYSSEKHDADQQALRTMGAKFEALQFEGGHECSGDFLTAAGNFLHRATTSP